MWPQVCFYVDKAKVILHYPPIINILRLDKIMPHHNTALAFALFLYPPSSFIILKYKQLIIINYLWLVFIQNPFIISPHLSQYYILGQLIFHAEQHYRNPCCTSERSEGRKKRSGQEWFWIIRAVSEIKKHTVRNSKGEKGNGEVGGDEGLTLLMIKASNASVEQVKTAWKLLLWTDCFIAGESIALFCWKLPKFFFFWFALSWPFVAISLFFFQPFPFY